MAKKEKPNKQRDVKSITATADCWYRDVKQISLLLAVIAVTFICFSPILSKEKEFINFDDPVYITKQDLITKLDAKHIGKMFTEHDASLNYHPITMLSLALNYYFSQLNPTGYFFTNLLFHLLNTFLVFILLYRLSGRNFITGLIAAFLFGVHPMHVESVAWAAERKDVLYCFFFLASCITYINYVERKQIKYLVFCFVLFLLSCLSKAMAVPLPLVLILIDYYKQRKFTAQTVTEKIPFFFLSLVIGYIAIKVQSKGAISDLNQVTLPQRFMYASYGFIMYFEKLLLPIGLSAFYPYPTLVDGSVLFIYKVAPVIALSIVAIPLFIAYKKDKEHFRILLFGIGFFVLMVALVLQFLSVGAAIMADRYSYLPYIGLFFIVATYITRLLEISKSKMIISIALVVFAIALSYVCYARVQVWQNDEILWTDVIDKYPPVSQTEGNTMQFSLAEGVNIAYENRANYYRMHGDMDKAFKDYELLIRFHPKNEGVYNNIANFYSMKAHEALTKGNKDSANEMFTNAINMYSEAIKINPTDILTLRNRALTYSDMGDHNKALDDFSAALALTPGDNSLLANIGNEKTQLGKYVEGIDDFTRCLSATPDDAMLLYFRGTAYVNIGKYTEGINDLALSVKNNPSLGNAWYNLSFAYNKAGNKQAALDAAQTARKNGYPVSDQYMESLNKNN